MERRVTSWYSNNLQMDMPLVAYGHAGYPLLMFPTAAADYLEYERFLLLDAIKPFIESGKPVFAAEYTDLGGDFASYCQRSKQLNFSTILKHRGLDAWIQTCPSRPLPSGEGWGEGNLIL